MELSSDKLSLKSILFNRVIPNYVPPVPTKGYKIHSCTDCSDRFIYEASYEHHVNRKSLKITYFCKYCSAAKTFYNRCNLLSHIRSHVFKTATINLTDLKIEPLPIEFYNSQALNQNKSREAQKQNVRNQKVATKDFLCHECKVDINATGVRYKDRANHYLQNDNEVPVVCPICKFETLSSCAMKAHLRVHLRVPPYFCSDCGIQLSGSCMFYTSKHDCNCFKAMHAAARLKCPDVRCGAYHPKELREHLVDQHLKKVYKCTICHVACFDETIMNKHSKYHNTDVPHTLYYRCDICPSKLIMPDQIDSHLVKTHAQKHVYPCLVCETIFMDVNSIIEHSVVDHNFPTDFIMDIMNVQRTYRVVKRCDQCDRNFTYKCSFAEIKTLPNECPYKCTNAENQITCHLCKVKMSPLWKHIKVHYQNHHKSYKCLDLTVSVEKIDVQKYLKKLKKQNGIRMGKMKAKNQYYNKNLSTPTSGNSDSNVYICKMCNHNAENKENFETHMLTHRDPCMAYQCMDCGQSFVVKPSFSTHLLLEHGVKNADEYISKKKCYNETALLKYPDVLTANEPLCENQCNICREQFNSSEDLEKHFRVHGMAFLKKNNSKSNSP